MGKRKLGEDGEIIEIGTPETSRKWFWVGVFTPLAVAIIGAIALVISGNERVVVRMGYAFSDAAYQDAIAQSVHSTLTSLPSQTPIIETAEPEIKEVPVTVIVDRTVVAERIVTTTPLPAPTDIPRPTLTPTPILALPFEDNFDTGARNEWTVLSGEWFTVGDRYTIRGGDGWTRIGDSTWNNYAVELDVIRNYPGSANTGTVTIGVRANSRNSDFPAFVSSNLGRCNWVTTSPNGRSTRITNQQLCPSANRVQFRIEVRDNSYIAFINGQVFQTFTLSGYTSGSVVLGIDCSTTGCIEFDNFQVTYLN